MKKYLLQSTQPEMESMVSLFAEMVLDEALLKFRKEQLELKIDQALRDKKKDDFMKFSKELKEICHNETT
ncbi:IDEAL domain-containing protein [Rossellomorea aquimaris]|uniref:IDEAL domain-containing protein n=1 Tax=Rossellomorea aquimaris TaxID=189382 RepID=UPI001CD2CB31|nr:IDEAL domain-containing protein [Rossellomorea aquimaris]MCA1053978.1 IDEAL domain-containing protein [Rossellomorea aquimaris]